MDNITKLNNAAGVLAGDLFVCGVVLSQEQLKTLQKVNDSKKLTEKKRAEWYPVILQHSTDHELVRISPADVDKINIFQARMLGFKRAIEELARRTGASYAVIDGNKKPDGLAIEVDVLIKADALLPGVSCASVLAKHQHTEYIKTLCQEEQYRKYGLDKHKGYGTALHSEMLKKYGPIPGFHRFSYQPVKESIQPS